MGGFDPIDDDPDFIDFLRVLVERGELEGAALGVTKQTIARGVESLSAAQRVVLEKHVIRKHAIEYCERGSESIPWSQMADALDNGGYCGYCANTMAKIMAE